MILVTETSLQFYDFSSWSILTNIFNYKDTCPQIENLFFSEFSIVFLQILVFELIQGKKEEEDICIDILTSYTKNILLSSSDSRMVAVFKSSDEKVGYSRNKEEDIEMYHNHWF